MARLSGIQKEVLSLYRKILRQAVEKDREKQANTASSRIPFTSLLQNDKESTTTSYAAEEFRRQATSVKRSNFKKVEYMIRKGEKQLKLLKTPGVKVVGGAS